MMHTSSALVATASEHKSTDQIQRTWHQLPRVSTRVARVLGLSLGKTDMLVKSAHSSSESCQYRVSLMLTSHCSQVHRYTELFCTIFDSNVVKSGKQFPLLTALVPWISSETKMCKDKLAFNSKKLVVSANCFVRRGLWKAPRKVTSCCHVLFPGP